MSPCGDECLEPWNYDGEDGTAAVSEVNQLTESYASDLGIAQVRLV